MPRGESSPNANKCTGGQSPPKAWRRFREVAVEARRFQFQSKVDKQQEGVAWSRDTVVDCPANGSIYRYTPHFVVSTWTHTQSSPPPHTHTNKKPHSLRSSIYPLKLSKGSGENTFSGLSTLKTLFPQGSVSKLWLITGCYIMCLCLKGSTVTHRTPAHCRV